MKKDGRSKYNTEQIQNIIKTVESNKAQGISVANSCKKLKIPHTTYYGWVKGGRRKDVQSVHKTSPDVVVYSGKKAPRKYVRKQTTNTVTTSTDSKAVMFYGTPAQIAEIMKGIES